MTDDMAEAKERAVRATAELRYQEVLADLRSRSGLAFASVGEDDELGPYLVTNDGKLIAKVWSEQQTAVRGWYVAAFDGDREGEPEGPFITIRAAAASRL